LSSVCQNVLSSTLLFSKRVCKKKDGEYRNETDAQRGYYVLRTETARWKRIPFPVHSNHMQSHTKRRRSMMETRKTENADEELLGELSRTAAMGIEAMEIVIPKSSDDALRGKLERQEKSYRRLAERARALMEQKGLRPQAESPLQKAMLWGSVQMTTLADTSPSHLAELTINGTTMGIVSLTKSLHDLPHADGKARSLAEEFLSAQQQTVEELKAFL
jgi:hypothetical protein